MSFGNKIYVVAASYNDYMDFCRRRGVLHEVTRYISRPLELRGLNNITVYLSMNFRRADNIEDILRELLQREQVRVLVEYAGGVFDRPSKLFDIRDSKNQDVYFNMITTMVQELLKRNIVLPRGDVRLVTIEEDLSGMAG